GRQRSRSRFFSRLRVPTSPNPSLIVYMRAQQVEQRKKEYPNYVDKMPIQTRYLDRRVVLRSKAPALRHYQYYRHYPEADDHVKRVNAGHHEVDEVKHLHVLRIAVALPLEPESRNQVIRPFCVILVSLHPEKGR